MGWTDRAAFMQIRPRPFLLKYFLTRYCNHASLF
jgi:hypothetical protein